MVLSVSHRRMLLGRGSSGAAVPPAWAPSDVAGLMAWWDAAAAYMTKDGSNYVSQWSDRSSSARHATQATGANQPLWVSSVAALNNLPAVRFDGSNDQIDFTGTGLSAFTVFVVKAEAAPRSTYSGALDWSGAGMLGFGLVSQAANTTYELPHLTVRNGTTETGNHKATATYTAPSASARLQVWSSTPKYYEGGVEDTVAAGDSSYGGNGIRCSLGRSYGYWHGDLGEVLVYNAVLSADDRADVTDYLKTKYGIA